MLFRQTSWPQTKEQLKKAYGGGRWTPEEDMFKLFRKEKHPRQNSGHYAARLLSRFGAAKEKLKEVASSEEVQNKMDFIAIILKVQLVKELGKREGFPG